MDPHVASIVKALAYAENGGAPDVENLKKGKTGEAKSMFQFTPATWKNYAKQVYGNEHLPLTPENESVVVYRKVEDWVKKGHSLREIASMWNAGVGEPNAHTGKFSNGTSSVGVNKKYGVKFDVPGYADKVEKYANQFYDEVGQQQPQTQPKVPITVGPITSSGLMSGASNGSIPTTKKPSLTKAGGLLRGQFSYNKAQNKPN